MASALDASARRDLGGLQKDLAEAVARHLVAAGTLVDDDPEAALAHARYARRRASRIAVVREAAGIAAYHAGEWSEALAELRAARRMGGGPGHLAVMADLERAMGRPERAIELARGPEARGLGRGTQIELAIVVAGARRDLGELDAAVVGLQIPELEAGLRDPWSARLFYAYADNLLAAGRESDALQWFVHAADADVDGQTDAEARIAELTGEPLVDDGVEFAVEDALPDEAEQATPTGDDTTLPDGAATTAGSADAAIVDGPIDAGAAGITEAVTSSAAQSRDAAAHAAEPTEGAVPADGTADLALADGTVDDAVADGTADFPAATASVGTVEASDGGPVATVAGAPAAVDTGDPDDVVDAAVAADGADGAGSGDVAPPVERAESERDATAPATSADDR